MYIYTYMYLHIYLSIYLFIYIYIDIYIYRYRYIGWWRAPTVPTLCGSPAERPPQTPHTRTHTHSLSHTRTHTLFLSHTHTLSLSLFFLSLSHTLGTCLQNCSG